MTSSWIWIAATTFSMICPTVTATESSRREKTCAECAALAKVEREAKLEVLKENPDFASKSATAAKIITDMARKSPKLDETRVSSIVSIYRVLVPKDPVAAVVNLTFPVINTNREAFDAKIATLPKAESTLLMEAITKASLTVSLESGAKGATPTPPPAGTPGVNGDYE